MADGTKPVSIDDFPLEELHGWFHKMSGHCDQCSKPFLKTYLHQRFCGDECSKQWHKACRTKARQLARQMMKDRTP